MNINDKNGWMVPCYDGYLEFPKQDESGIAVTVWNHMISVQPHKHHFQEFALITKGYCIHKYEGVEVPLMPGDVFLIRPHKEHSYLIQSPIELINCQFYSEQMNEVFQELLQEVEIDEKHLSRQSQLNQQGVLHLNMEELQEIEFLLNQMMKEQEHKESGLEQIKMACLQMILVKFSRIRKRQNEQLGTRKNYKKDKIYEILAYVEEHLAEEINFNEIATNAYWSVGHFRAVFKDVTGLTPTEYLNRLRIIKSLEYIQKDGLSVSEASECVGILDAAYFSRLFKKVMGYSPRYFKKIEE